MQTILTASKLGKSVATAEGAKHILKDVDLSIQQGEYISVMGPSGSGKSTLLYTLSGMDRMSEGSVVFAGTELAGLPEKKLAAIRLSSMGFVFQQSNLLKNLGILDNVLLSSYLARKEARSTLNERGRALMERLGILDLTQRRITEVSGGQLQRAAICRALINQPRIIFCDEPTGVITSRSAAEVLDILSELHAAGSTILVVTHDAKVAARTERVLYMLDGRIGGELPLGPCERGIEDLTRREQKTLGWLMDLGW